MIQRTTRDYEVSLWSLQDSFIAILKQYGLEYKGQIEEGRLTDRDDGTQSFSFSIPMYLYTEGQKIENPSWYSVKQGALMINMRKIKVIFNKEDKDNRKIYEFVITRVTQRHEDQQLYCDVECEGLAFHELGKIGYKITLSAQDFYNDDQDWFLNGKWYNGYGKEKTEQPLANLQYWNDKVFSTVSNWTYKICMNWDAHSLATDTMTGNINDIFIENDIVTITSQRKPDCVYEEDYVDAWKTDTNTGNLIPSHITEAREKARIGIDIKESNVYNITQTLAETFGVFCKYVYSYDDNCHIIDRTVVYYNNYFNQESGSLDLNYPQQTSSIKRSIDSNDLITKMYVKSVENTASSSGLTNIADVGANKAKEDYILNFDYLHAIGGITDEQYEFIDQYITLLHKYNEKLDEISNTLITLEGELPKVEAEITFKQNAIIQDTEELEKATYLESLISKNEGVIHITAAKPQTAVLLKDNSKQYPSYYVKISQLGVFAETIHLYKTYDYRHFLEDEILTGKVEYDEYGNVIRISNIYISENESKTVYITYDYRPALYYTRVRNTLEVRLATDEADLQAAKKQLAELKYKLNGELPSDTALATEIASKYTQLQIFIREKYKILVEEKNKLIKQFNANFGPAIREGYWQPETYTDYGDRENELLMVTSNAFTPQEGVSKKSYFQWDPVLFDNEQKLYYEYSVAQNKYAYPCIDLRKTPEIFKFIQEHIDEPISFVYTPTSSQQIAATATATPTITNLPSELTLLEGLYEFNDNTWSVKNKYENLGNKYSGIITPRMSQTDKTDFYYIWSIKENNQENETVLFNTKKQSPVVADGWESNIHILNQKSGQILICPTSSHPLNNCTLILTAGNSQGFRSKNIILHRLNKTQIKQVSLNKSKIFAAHAGSITLTFKLVNYNAELDKYILQIYSEQQWHELTTDIDGIDSINQEFNASSQQLEITVGYTGDFAALEKQVIKLRLQIQDIEYQLTTNSNYSIVSEPIEISIQDDTPWIEIDNNKSVFTLNHGFSYSPEQFKIDFILGQYYDQDNESAAQQFPKKIYFHIKKENNIYPFNIQVQSEKTKAEEGLRSQEIIIRLGINDLLTETEYNFITSDWLNGATLEWSFNQNSNTWNVISTPLIINQKLEAYWDDSGEENFLKPQIAVHVTPQEYSYTMKFINATSIHWNITNPNHIDQQYGNQEEYNVDIDLSNIQDIYIPDDSNEDNYRYKFSTDITQGTCTLIISVPGTGEDMATWDDGTIISWYCENNTSATEDSERVNSNGQIKLTIKQLYTISNPVTEEFKTIEWWPYDNTKIVNQFMTVYYESKFNINTTCQQYLVNISDNPINDTAAAEAWFNEKGTQTTINGFTASIRSVQSLLDDDKHYSIYWECQSKNFEEFCSNTDDGSSIINTSARTNDQKYAIILKYNVNFVDQTWELFDQTWYIKIIIRQAPPSGKNFTTTDPWGLQSSQQKIQLINKNTGWISLSLFDGLNVGSVQSCMWLMTKYPLPEIPQRANPLITFFSDPSKRATDFYTNQNGQQCSWVYRFWDYSSDSREKTLVKNTPNLWPWPVEGESRNYKEFGINNKARVYFGKDHNGNKVSKWQPGKNDATKATYYQTGTRQGEPYTVGPAHYALGCNRHLYVKVTNYWGSTYSPVLYFNKR